MPRHESLPQNLPPRGLNRDAAAQYIGIGVGMFDQMVKSGRMPQPIRIGGRKVWDRYAIDDAFDALSGGAPRASSTGWEDFLDGRS
jgi:predicted DNA-binding transcriptional regulator AlpA